MSDIELMLLAAMLCIPVALMAGMLIERNL